MYTHTYTHSHIDIYTSKHKVPLGSSHKIHQIKNFIVSYFLLKTLGKKTSVKFYNNSSDVFNNIEFDISLNISFSLFLLRNSCLLKKKTGFLVNWEHFQNIETHGVNLTCNNLTQPNLTYMNIYIHIYILKCCFNLT